jgi:hypothetical protein
MKKLLYSVTIFMLTNTCLFGQEIMVKKNHLNIDFDSSLKNQIRPFSGDSMNITAMSKNKAHYDLLIKKPDESIDYKKQVVRPDTSQDFSMIIIDPETGRRYNYLSYERNKELNVKISKVK